MANKSLIAATSDIYVADSRDSVAGHEKVPGRFGRKTEQLI